MAIVRNSLLGLVAASVVHGAAIAQHDKTVNEAFSLLMNGKSDEAVAKLKEVIQADPSQKDAFDLYQKVKQYKWEEMLMKEGEMGKLTQHLLKLAKSGRRDLSRDEASIKALVEKAVHGPTHGERMAATQDIIVKHGEFAVPEICKTLGNHDDSDGQTNAIIALRQMGRSATLPLVEATASDSATLRRNIAAVFNLTRDHRAVPALTTLVKDDNEGVVEGARAALKGMGASATADAVSLFLKQSQNYMVGIGTSGSDVSDVVWSYSGGKLSAKDCHPAVYQFELAKKSAERAFAMDPGSSDATTLVARSYLAQVASIDNGNLEDLKGVRANLQMAAMAMGPQVLGNALKASMRDRQPMVAVAAIDALAETEDKDSLGSSPLLDALKSDNKIVSYAAALALTQASRANNVPQSSVVVGVLAQAVAEQNQKRIATVGLDNANSVSVGQIIGPRNGQVLEASFKDATSAGASMYSRSVAADVVVINEILEDAIPETLIRILKKNDRTSNVKVIIVAKDVEKAKATYGDRVAGVIQAGFKPEELQPLVDAALADRKDEVQERAGKVAIDASSALLTLAKNRVDVGSALDSLATQLKRKGPVAINCAMALGESGSSIDPLVEQILGDADTDLKKACAAAVGKIVGRGVDVGAHFDKLKDVAADSKTDAGLRIALAVALGKAKLDPSQRRRLNEALSTAAVAGGE